MKTLFLIVSLCLCATPVFAQPSSGRAAEQAAGDDGNAGGAAFADFDSLMQLIQTTVAPDSWEALGGASTMSPYPQGIYVDPQGIVQTIVTTDTADGQSLTALRAAFSADAFPKNNPSDQPGDWRRASKRRCVSLSGLIAQVRYCVDHGQALAPEMLHLAGLSSAEQIVLTGDDVRIFGSVGGIVDFAGMPIDHTNAASPIELCSLIEACRSVVTGSAIGCTIDPTRQGLAAAAAIGDQLASGEVSFAAAQSAMTDALGLQDVGVFGLAADSPVAYRMIAVDRHMKQLALGLADMPAGVPNYLDCVQRHIAGGVPDDLLLRLWLTADPITVRSDNDRQIFQLSGRPIRLSGQNQLALADGGRGAIRLDPASDDFVRGFNDNWSAIRQRYPAYGAIESLFMAAAIAETINRYGDDVSGDIVLAVGKSAPARGRRAQDAKASSIDRRVQDNPPRSPATPIIGRQRRRFADGIEVDPKPAGNLPQPRRPSTTINDCGSKTEPDHTKNLVVGSAKRIAVAVRIGVAELGIILDFLVADSAHARCRNCSECHYGFG